MRLRVALGRAVAAAVVEQRQLDVLERGGAGEQAEVLEDEADLPVAQLGAPVAVEARDVLAVEEVAARTMGRSSRPRMFMSVDLPEPEAPTTAMKEPGAMSRSTPRRACTTTSPSA